LPAGGPRPGRRGILVAWPGHRQRLGPLAYTERDGNKGREKVRKREGRERNIDREKEREMEE